jgi:hypothetical protein
MTEVWGWSDANRALSSPWTLSSASTDYAGTSPRTLSDIATLSHGQMRMRDLQKLQTWCRGVQNVSHEIIVG